MSLWSVEVWMRLAHNPGKRREPLLIKFKGGFYDNYEEENNGDWSNVNYVRVNGELYKVARATDEYVEQFFKMTLLRL